MWEMRTPSKRVCCRTNICHDCLGDLWITPTTYCVENELCNRPKSAGFKNFIPPAKFLAAQNEL